MRFYSKIVIDVATGNTIEAVSFEYDGPVMWLKGPTPEQNALALQEATFYKTLTADYNTMFAGQQAILGSIRTAFEPILQAGPSQKGLSAAAETAIRTAASDTEATQFANAQRTLNQELAARGTPAGVFSGPEAQLEASLLTSEAQAAAATQNQITTYNYDVGRQNFYAASQALGGAAGMMSPTPYAGAATGAGNAAFGAATTLYNEQQAASPWGTIGGILGGAAGAFLGPVGSALGSRLGSMIGGAAGGGGGGGSLAGTVLGDTSSAPASGWIP